MKFEVYCGDGSKRTFDSADEVSDFRNYHKDDCGGIERICVESDSGDHHDWTTNTNDFTWERSKQGEYSRYDHPTSDSSYDHPSSPHSWSTKTEMDGGACGVMFGAACAFAFISNFLPEVIGQPLLGIAGILFIIAVIKVIIHTIESL